MCFSPFIPKFDLPSQLFIPSELAQVQCRFGLCRKRSAAGGRAEGAGGVVMTSTPLPGGGSEKEAKPGEIEKRRP